MKAVLCLSFLLCLPSGMAATDSAQTPTIHVNVRLVNVFVNVSDPRGAPVSNLEKDNFQLSEDGQPQQIAVFERQSELPLNIVLAIDTSDSVRKDSNIELQAAHRFVRSFLRPVDRLELMEFSDNVREVVGFTNNIRRIDRGLNDIRGGAATALYSAIDLAAQRLEPYSGRKVLVLISDGSNTVGDTTYEMALQQAVRGEAAVYCIIDVPIEASAGRDLAGEHAMITLAEETGGRYFYADSASLDAIFAQVSQDLRTQYLLGYYPKSTSRNEGFRSISVHLKNVPPGSDYTVRNRTGYYPSLGQ